MASKKITGIPPGLDCPVCLNDIMKPPIFQCKSGHNMCSNCYMQLPVKICPTCRLEMITTPNLGLERIIVQLEVPCPNTSEGCKKSLKVGNSLEDHLAECIFRDMRCPLAIFGRCTWTGKLKAMMAHFKERHTLESSFAPKEDCILREVNMSEDDRHVYVFAVGFRIFFLTCKIDTSVGMTFWTIQHFATKDSAQTWLYDITIKSLIESHRSMTFTEHCFNDVMFTDDIFKTSRCAVVPIDYLRSFMVDKKVKFSFDVKNAASIVKHIDKRSDSSSDRFNSGRGNDNDGGSGDGNNSKFNGNKKDFKPHFHQNQDGKKFQGKKTHANPRRGNANTKNQE